ncbi:MAG: hypothetical protein R3D71_00170 [Rickettsiales bacterium]
MLLDPIFVWLVLGILFLIGDKLSGKYGFIYASYSAFFIAACVLLGIMSPGNALPNIISQVLMFFITAVVFWYLFREDPSKVNKEDKEVYKEVIGQVVEVADDGLNSISGGEVKWKDKLYPARLGGDVDGGTLDAGTKVLVQEVVSDTFIVILRKEE